VLDVIVAIAPATDVEHIRPDQPLREQIDLDSMDWLNVVIALHDRFGVDIPQADYGRLATLDSSRPMLRPEAEHPGAPSPAVPVGVAVAKHRVNGETVTVRPIHPEDAAMEADFVRHLSSDAATSASCSRCGALARQAQVPHRRRPVAARRAGATVEREGREVEVGVVRYIVDPAGAGCEFAIAVDDAWQGSGLAGSSHVMHALIGIARSRASPRWRAWCCPRTRGC